jgi:hypothetical protein
MKIHKDPQCHGMPTHTGPSCKGWCTTLDATPEGYQQLLENRCTHQLFFFNYRKTRTLLTPLDNYKKTKAKKPKTPLNLRQKKVDFRCYAVIKL